LGWKDFFRKLAHGAKVFGVSVSASIALNRKRNELKKVLLSRFKVRQLDEVARRLGVSLRGARTKDGKVSVLAKHLSFEDAVKLAKRYKVRYKDVLEELDRFRAELESRKAKVKLGGRLEEIVNALIAAINEFRPEPVRDEEDLEKQLYQYLRAKFPKLPIKRQAKLGEYRIDLVVGPCGIELKVPKSSTHLQRLIGQIRDYSQYLDCVIAVVLDAGVTREISRYTDRLEEMGIIPVVIKGKLKS